MAERSRLEWLRHSLMKSETVTSANPFKCYEMITDGGSRVVSKGIVSAASACRIRCNETQHLTKIVAYLGEASSFEAELCAGIFGLEAILGKGADGDSIRVRWITDFEPFVLALTDVSGARGTRRVPACLHAFRERVQLEVIHLSDSKRKAEHQSCDRACCWILRRGKAFLDQWGAGPVGNEHVIKQGLAWNLIDGRVRLANLRNELSCKAGIQYGEHQQGEFTPSGGCVSLQL